MKPLYHVDFVREADGGYDCGIHLDPSHLIYQAHFPGEPITPGVCILQMSVQILSQVVAAPLKVVRFKNVKFLQILVPGATQDIVWRFRDIRPDGDAVEAQCVLLSGESVIAKLTVLCRKS